jgi:hypothetical protein
VFVKVLMIPYGSFPRVVLDGSCHGSSICSRLQSCCSNWGFLYSFSPGDDGRLESAHPHDQDEDEDADIGEEREPKSQFLGSVAEASISDSFVGDSKSLVNT